VTVTLVTIDPNKPVVIPSPQFFCESARATLATLIVPNNQIVWYAAATGGQALSPNTILSAGYYYAAQRVGACESATRTSVEVRVGESSNAPVANSPQNMGCNATVGDLAVTGSSVRWYDVPIGGTPLALTAALENGKKYYASQVSGACESAERAEVLVSIATPAAPIVTTPNQFFCDFEGRTLADLEPRGLGVRWYAAATGGSVLSLATVLTTGTTYYAATFDGTCESTGRSRVTSYTGIQILQKDDHILWINNNKDTNGELDFNFYTWKKDGAFLKEGAWGEAQGGYYYTGSKTKNLEVGVEYIVELKGTDKFGINFNTETCPLVLTPADIKGNAQSISVYPNPLVSSDLVYVDANVDESVLETAYIEIYSPIGSYVGNVKAQRLTPVRLPQENGVYILKFKSAEIEEYFKIIVK
jgi:hypothetical protein